MCYVYNTYVARATPPPKKKNQMKEKKNKRQAYNVDICTLCG